MSMTTRTVLLALGGLILFVAAAGVGWALAADRSPESPWLLVETNEVSTGQEIPAEAVAAYPIRPSGPSEDGQDDGASLDQTVSFLSGADSADSVGDPKVGGQTLVDDEDSAFSENPPGDLPAEVPAVVLEDEPFLNPYLDELLRQADLGIDRPLGMDACAGIGPASSSLPGCPTFGVGGTIVATALTVLDPPKISLGVPDGHPECISTDDMFRMRLKTNRPGTFQSIMWTIDRTDPFPMNQPPGAQVVFGSTPDELDSAWLDEVMHPDTEVTPTFTFCIEAPKGVEQGTIQHAVLFTSTHPPDDDALVGDTAGFLFGPTASNVRPSTGLTSTTRDTLYVRVFRDSTEETSTVVQARLRAPSDRGGGLIELCDPNFSGLSPTEPEGSDKQGVLTDTYEIDTSTGDWPWDERWDTFDVHAVALNGSLVYSICIYEIDAAGDVVYAEAANVRVPGTRTTRVFVETIHTFDPPADADIQNVLIEAPAQPQCFPNEYEWPGANTAAIVVNRASETLEGGTFCVFQHTGGLTTNGGFFVELGLDRADGPNDIVQTWITIPRTDLLCWPNCATSEFVLDLPLPIPAGGTTIAGYVSFKVSMSEPGPFDRWTLGYAFPFLDE